MRYERKYKVEHLSLNLVEQEIRNHPASFRKIFPDRWVNNIYFDTPDFSAYKENVAGVNKRVKLRVRWYGENVKQINKPQLELKAKQNELGWKEIFPMNNFSLANLTAVRQAVNRKILELNNLQPVLLSRYLRSYFGTSNGYYRITIDRALQYYPLYLSNNFERFNIKDDGVVVELKYDQDKDDSANFIMQYLPYRQTKSSKYVTGVDLVLG